MRWVECVLLAFQGEYERPRFVWCDEPPLEFKFPIILKGRSDFDGSNFKILHGWRRFTRGAYYDTLNGRVWIYDWVQGDR